MKAFAGTMLVLAWIIAGCSATGTASDGPSPSAQASLATANLSPLAGPVSTTVPASVAPAGAVIVQLAGPPPRFEPADLTTKPGDLVYYLDNDSLGTHTLAIGPSIGEILAVSGNVESGRAAVFTVRGLQTGQYVTWCTIGDHTALGMVGTLTVE